MERRDRLSRVAEVAIWPEGRESRAKEAKGERLPTDIRPLGQQPPKAAKCKAFYHGWYSKKIYENTTTSLHCLHVLHCLHCLHCLVLTMLTMHYGIRAMGAMSKGISELCLPFSPYPNNSDGNFNLVHHFLYARGQLSLEQMKKKEKVKVKSQIR